MGIDEVRVCQVYVYGLASRLAACAPEAAAFRSMMISSRSITPASIKGRSAYCPAAALHPVPATSRASLIWSR